LRVPQKDTQTIPNKSKNPPYYKLSNLVIITRIHTKFPTKFPKITRYFTIVTKIQKQIIYYFPVLLGYKILTAPQVFSLGNSKPIYYTLAIIPDKTIPISSIKHPLERPKSK
jgi:hypothetical protein